MLLGRRLGRSLEVRGQDGGRGERKDTGGGGPAGKGNLNEERGGLRGGDGHCAEMKGNKYRNCSKRHHGV